MLTILSGLNMLSQNDISVSYKSNKIVKKNLTGSLSDKRNYNNFNKHIPITFHLCVVIGYTTLIIGPITTWTRLQGPVSI